MTVKLAKVKITTALATWNITIIHNLSQAWEHLEVNFFCTLYLMSQWYSLRFSENLLNFSRYITTNSFQWCFLDWNSVKFYWISDTFTDSSLGCVPKISLRLSLGWGFFPHRYTWKSSPPAVSDTLAHGWPLLNSAGSNSHVIYDCFIWGDADKGLCNKGFRLLFWPKVCRHNSLHGGLTNCFPWGNPHAKIMATPPISSPWQFSVTYESPENAQKALYVKITWDLRFVQKFRFVVTSHVYWFTQTWSRFSMYLKKKFVAE